MNSKLGRLCAVTVLLCVAAILASCGDDDDKVVYRSRYQWSEKTIAVVAPTSDAATHERLMRTAEWFAQNLEQSQLKNERCLRLRLEWYDELSEDLTALSRELAERDDVTAIIGPFGNDNMAIFAAACQKVQKPLIAPTTTSEDVIRRFAVGRSGAKNKTPFLWSLTETDVAMSEVLMSVYATLTKFYDYKMFDPSAALFAPDDTYGRTFSDWAPYQAENMDINLTRNSLYSDDEDLLRQMNGFLDSAKGNATVWSLNSFCVIENAHQLYEIARQRRKWLIDNDYVLTQSRDADDELNDEHWSEFESVFRTWFAFSDLSDENITRLGQRAVAMLQGYQGFSPYADPTTGFELSYEKRFHQLPTFAECKFYDALMLVAFAAYYDELTNSEDEESTESAADAKGSPTAGALAASEDRAKARNMRLNQAIIAITNDVQDEPQLLSGAVWNPTTMEVYLGAMQRGQLLKFRGASGDISFDQDTYTTATHSTYVHWRIMDGKIEHLNYLGSDGQNRISQSTAAWRWLYDEKRALDDLAEQAEDESTAISYPALTAQYALLVQGSSGFINYRHQADVLNMYQLLRRNGFDDDHIILIVDNTIATDYDNHETGVIRSQPDGPDLYGGTTPGYPKAVVDYDNITLRASDVANILTGTPTERTPTVLDTGTGEEARGANILFYWSGHGRSKANGGSDEFRWRDLEAGRGFTADMLTEAVSQLYQQQRFRKMLVIVEPCYGEVVIKPLTGITGVLGMSGASATEQSFADHWSPDLGHQGTWMSDSFSSNLVGYLANNPATTYRDLFLYCAQHTLGSHARIINAAHFGNLYVTGPQEFIKRQ